MNVAAVSFSTPQRVAAFLKEMPQPFAVLADPTMTGYRTFALARTSLWAFFRPRVLRRYLGLILRGWLPGKPAKEDDIFQLGGDYLIDAEGRLAYVHPSLDAGDRPTIAELLAAIERLSATRA